MGNLVYLQAWPAFEGMMQQGLDFNPVTIEHL